MTFSPFPFKPTGYVFEFPEFSSEIRSAWGWIIAFYAWDHGDTKPLCELICSDETLPNALKPALAKRLSGEIKQRADKAKIKAYDRMLAAMKISVHLYLSKANETYGLSQDLTCRYIDYLADETRREVIDVKRDMQKYRRTYIRAVADKLKISTETVENFLREMRTLANRYPDV